MDNKPNLKYINQEQSLNDEFDLTIILSFLLRNKKIIGFIAIISFLIGCIYSLTLKRVWEGQFQIVLNQRSENSRIINSNLANLLNRSTSNDLKTQVGILNSPSVLMPIYDLVNSKNNSNSEDNLLPFNIWKRSLDVELEKDTSILNIAYRDTNKDLILPVLKNLSSIYQEYSGRKNKVSQQAFKLYLQKQIGVYKKKSSNSIKMAQNYAIDQDLIFLSPKNIDASFVNSNSLETSNLTPLNVSIEEIRVNAANKIRILDSQIKKITELNEKESENIQYIGSTIPALIDQNLPQELQEIEIELVDLRSKYTEDDRSIKTLVERRDLMIELLKERTIKYLKAERLETEALMEASMRPKGILLKYKELIRESSRDELTLINLENDLRLVELEEAKAPDPWQLITQPKIMSNPVAPSRRKIGIIALIYGFLFGSLIAFLKEFKTGKIFYLQSMDKILSVPLIDKISTKGDFENPRKINFLFNFIKNQTAKNISFISIDNNNHSLVERLSYLICEKNKLNKKINCIFSKDELSSSIDSEFVLIFVSLDESNSQEIKDLKFKLNLLNVKLNGYILLN
mgnify:CR=1 FL=1